MFEKVKLFVDKAFEGKRVIKHFERTVYWLKHFKLDVDEAFLIAAYAHDIERGFRKPEISAMHTDRDAGFLDEEFLKHHQEKGAEIIGEFLRKNKYPEKDIERVKMLVSKHEVGGNEEQNLLKDCDSISFFEIQASHFIENKVQEVGKEKVKNKFDWMFNRITSKKAKEIAKPLYEKAIRDLG